MAEKLAPYVKDTSLTLHKSLKAGKRVLAEGAQGTLLDLDHGTYPFVTSSYPTAPGALVGLGLGFDYVNRVIGVTKAFQTRVGSGPFPTELTGKLAGHLRGTGDNPWDEFGTTTGRARRVGWLDAVLLRYAARINGLTELVLTKLDILSGLEMIHICTGYATDGRGPLMDDIQVTDLGIYQPLYKTIHGWNEDLREVREWSSLPKAARKYIRKIEQVTELPIRMVSVGPERDQVIEIPEDSRS
jgi:adenylosuccinate synthase